MSYDRQAALPRASNLPALTPARNACHSADVYSSTGPPGSLESRTPTPPSGREVACTQSPLPRLCVDLIHFAVLSYLSLVARAR